MMRRPVMAIIYFCTLTNVLYTVLTRESHWVPVMGLWLIVTIALLFLLYRGLQKNVGIQRTLARRDRTIILQRNELETLAKRVRRTFIELREMQSQLIQAEKMAALAQLTAGIAHELNNPINFIMGGVQGLKTQLDFVSANEEMKQKLENIPAIAEMLGDMELFANAIEAGAVRSAKIVEELVNFSFQDNQYLSYVNLRSYLDSVLILLGGHLGDRIKVYKNFGTIPMVECNIGEINQVFVNVLMNAIQAIQDVGDITVTTCVQKSGFVNVIIRDSGCGIPDAIAERIFDPFFTTREVGKGTGLGLYISYKIIQNHHGHIFFNSEPGKGTEFTISIPVTRDERHPGIIDSDKDLRNLFQCPRWRPKC
ncbi:sensor histidine kinase [Chryseolinea soli]|nr:ATP-binding protein [Chryseolinea soli]